MKITSSRQTGIVVRERRTALGMTQKALARESGVSERLVASLEAGDATGIRLDKLLAILNALGLPLRIGEEEAGEVPGNSQDVLEEYGRAFALAEERIDSADGSDEESTNIGGWAAQDG